MDFSNLKIYWGDCESNCNFWNVYHQIEEVFKKIMKYENDEKAQNFYNFFSWLNNENDEKPQNFYNFLMKMMKRPKFSTTKKSRTIKSPTFKGLGDLKIKKKLIWAFVISTGVCIKIG